MYKRQPAESLVYDAIIIGAGHNGLVAAAYLAKAGMRVVVAERRDVIGGAAVSEEVWPGWTVSVASYVCSLLHPDIVRDLTLRAHGYEAYRKDPASFTPLDNGRSLLLGADQESNDREIGAFARADIAGFRAFDKRVQQLGAFIFGRMLVDDDALPQSADYPHHAFEVSD